MPARSGPDCNHLVARTAERIILAVEWFNAVDTTYKADLRDLVEIQAQRFDAKLEQRLAEVRAELRSGLADLRADLLKWMFVYWAGTALTVIGLLKL